MSPLSLPYEVGVNAAGAGAFDESYACEHFWRITGVQHAVCMAPRCDVLVLGGLESTGAFQGGVCVPRKLCFLFAPATPHPWTCCRLAGCRSNESQTRR